MKNKYKNITTNLLLSVLILVTLWGGYVVFIGGPAQAYKEEDRLFVQSIVDQEGFDQAILLNRFSYDRVYYIVAAKKDDKEIITWFSSDFELIASKENVGFEPVLTLASNFGVPESDLSYGVYNKRLVYVLKNKTAEVFVDAETLEIVFHFGGV